MKKQLLIVAILLISGLTLSVVFGNNPTKNSTEKNNCAAPFVPSFEEQSVNYTSSTKDTVELGKVAWIRNYDAAVQLAKKQGKPIFILFQEVPGCLNCKRFGREVMSNPLVVDVIENEFVPLCIFNNKRGADARILKKFSEPSWNNPVVRIINPSGKDITKRMGSFHPKQVINGIAHALKKSNKKVPTYFQLLQKQVNAQYGTTEKAVFPMYCFWSGELKLGQIKGVVNTKPGFMNGREVVEVQFDKQQTSFRDLLKTAKKYQAIEGAFVNSEQQKSIAKKEFNAVRKTGRFRLDGEPKYYMSKTSYKHLPMLPLQRIKVNLALYAQQNPQQFLSPSQIRLYKQIRQSKVKLPDYSVSESIVDDWEALNKKLR
ncbi:MAG TPA: hypothetical protein DCS93_11280 [Microscillaceae bacterium]|nr:hypothetical protein [Microscillaceae bacterium]